MNILTTFPHSIQEMENIWIPMSDGIHLAARIWMPEGADRKPVPAILEYIPYRKRDITAYRDSITHPYFAGHGYACLRVDLRGSGESDGVLTDEYLDQELNDGVEVLRWIANQPWCSGDIGMIGISWGGFNGLGDNLSWASSMFAYNSCPPDPALVGDRWRDMWIERLTKSGLWLDTWLQHQRRDSYWKHGSICEDFSAITCPVFALSGWTDGYSNAVFRLLTHLTVPGFLQEALRWWDHWLKGIETGIMGEPMLRVWMQESVPPTTSYEFRPGRWVGESSWPSPQIEHQNFSLAPGRLVSSDEPLPEKGVMIQSPLSVGLFAGKWCSYAAGPDLAHDQREEDGGALVFDSAPLSKPMEVLGAPIVELDLMANKPVAMVAIRLSDIAPDDKATRVTYGLLNLTHRESREHPEYVDPTKRYQVRLTLNHIAQVFPKNHRVRIAISTSYWPLAWPPPEPVRLTIFTGSSSLNVPIRSPQKIQAQLTSFGEPEGAPPLSRTLIEPEHHNWRVIRDLAKDESTLEVVNDKGIYRLNDIDLEVQNKTLEWYTYRADDFESVRGETQCTRGFRRGDWTVKTVTKTVLTSSATHFHILADLDAYEGDKRVYCQSWDRTIPRDFV
jgi:predicted acyl esterase